MFSEAYTLGSCFDSIVSDTEDVMSKLGDNPVCIGEELLIQSELPARAAPDVLIGLVRRWREIQMFYNRPLRIIALSYNSSVEKHILGLVQNMPNVLITVIPTELLHLRTYTE